MLRNKKALIMRALLRSKNYVVITDHDSAMLLNVKNPRTLTDQIMLGQYRASLTMFQDQIKKVIAAYDKRMEEVTGGNKKSAKGRTRK